MIESVWAPHRAMSRSVQLVDLDRSMRGRIATVGSTTPQGPATMSPDQLELPADLLPSGTQQAQATKQPSHFLSSDQFTDLITAARDGENWAYEALYLRYRGGLIASARRRGVEDPEGVANAVLTRVLTRLDSFTGKYPGEFTNFVRTTGWRETTRALTKESNRNRDLEIQSVSARVQPVEDVVAGSDWVKQALEQLPEGQRRVVQLRVLEDLSVAETSERLGWTETNVRTLQHRAIRSLRASLVARVARATTSQGACAECSSECCDCQQD